MTNTTDARPPIGRLRRPELPGFALASAVGGAALLARPIIPRRLALPDVLIALLLGQRW